MKIVQVFYSTVALLGAVCIFTPIDGRAAPDDGALHWLHGGGHAGGGFHPAPMPHYEPAPPHHEPAPHFPAPAPHHEPAPPHHEPAPHFPAPAPHHEPAPPPHHEPAPHFPAPPHHEPAPHFPAPPHHEPAPPPHHEPAPHFPAPPHHEPAPPSGPSPLPPHSPPTHGSGHIPSPPQHHEPPRSERTLPSGAVERHYHDGSRQIVSHQGTKEVAANGHVTYIDPQGRITRQVHNGVHTTYHEDGSRSVTVGNRHYTERVNDHDGHRTRERHYDYDSSVNHHHCDHHREYFEHGCRYWHEPLWFYTSGFTMGVLSMSFFGPSYAASYYPMWDWSYWNAYPWSSYGWWHYYSSWMWHPWSYYYYQQFYRPSFALLDFVLASTYEIAWEARLQQARDAVLQQYEDQILAASSAAEAAQLQAAANAAATDAANLAASAAQAEAQAQAAAAGNQAALGQTDQTQLATQVEQAIADRHANVSTDAAFEAALSNDAYLYLVSLQPEESYAGVNGACQLHMGDVLQRQALATDTGLATMLVKVAQPGSCPAGSTVTMTVAQLASMFNTFQEHIDNGAQQLADGNQPH